MERIFSLGKLLDYYGAMLTERKYSLVSQYVFEDCSLAEISEREGISRQAVHDAVSSSETELSRMEEKLGMIRRAERIRHLIGRAEEATSDPELLDILSQMRRALEDSDGV